MTSIQDQAAPLHRVGDPEAESLLRCYYIASFLDDCIVESKYKPPPALTSTLRLTPRGKQLANHVKGDGIGLPEAQLAAFLTIWAGNDLLIDHNDLDLNRLRDHVSLEIRRRKIKYPWVYGRKLYDAVADSSFHGASSISHEETVELLDQLPQGVFQLGPYVTGPYGLIESRQWRIIGPRTIVPAYHCEQRDCDIVHTFYLRTGETSVSKAHTAAEKRTAKEHTTDTAYVEAIINLQARLIPEYKWVHAGTLPYFLFDSFALTDIRLLLSTLLDTDGGQLRAACGDLDLAMRESSVFVESLDLGQLLQVLLLAYDRDIHVALNRLIASKKILVAEGELRRSKIMKRGTGPLDITMQASRLGVRYKPPNDLLQARLRRVIEAAFPASDRDHDGRLQWLLRGHDGGTSAAKLTHALLNEEPTHLVRRLLASDRDAYTAAFKELCLPPEDYVEQSDEDISRIVTWHIGFRSAERNAELASLRTRLSDLKTIVSGLPSQTLERSDVDRVRQVSGVLFPGLEEVLTNTLAYCTWCLLRDHLSDSYVLEYSRGRARIFLTEWLSTRQTNGTDMAVEKMTLGDILSCYGSLSKELADLESRSNEFQRAQDDWPRRFHLQDNPFAFPFPHTRPFLDLDDGSRRNIRDLIAGLCSSFQNEGVLEVRNALTHHSHEIPRRERLSHALGVIEARIGEIVSNGMYPLVYSVNSSHSDGVGRRTVRLRSTDGPEVLLSRPSSLDLAGFPYINSSQTVMVGARIGTSDEPLRFAWRVDSSYTEMWKNFPRHAPKKGAYQVSEAD